VPVFFHIDGVEEIFDDSIRRLLRIRDASYLGDEKAEVVVGHFTHF
jgi:hypothetical protein